MLEKFPKILCKHDNVMDWEFIVNNNIPTTACPFEEDQAQEIVNILDVEEIFLRPVSL